MPERMIVNCPACKAPAEAGVERIIDVRRQPQLKQALLGGQLNSVRCAACGANSALATPVLYHDPDNELLIACIPAELNLQGPQRDQALGDLLKELTARIPKEEFRGYMFQPKQVLTMQGLLEQVLEGDGVTKEVLETQRRRVELLGRLARAEPKRLRSLIREHDDEVDVLFFQAARAMMQQAAQGGQEPMVKALAAIQEAAAKHSSFGKQQTALAREQEKIVQDVARRLQALGESPARREVLALALDLAADEQRLQAFVGLVRPALDYPFFQELTLQIGRAPVADRPRLEALRDRLGELTREVDARTQASMQRAAGVLRTVMSGADADRALREHLAFIDESFMAVLAASITAAERRADVQASAKLKSIHRKAVTLIRQQMRPEVRFAWELLEAPDEKTAQAMLEDGSQKFGAALRPALAALASMLRQQGQAELARRMDSLHRAAGEKSPGRLN